MTASRSLPARFSPRPVRVLARRLARSTFAQDLYVHRYQLAGCALILACALVVALLTRGVVLTWEGYVDVRPATR